MSTIQRIGFATARTVVGCARCGETHHDMAFVPFLYAMSDWTHWGTCPTTGEPVLLKFVKDDGA